MFPCSSPPSDTKTGEISPKRTPLEGVPIDWGAIRELLQPMPARHRLWSLAGANDLGLVTRVATWLEARPEGNRNFPLFWAAKLITAAGLMDSDVREQLIAASLRSGLRGGEREARRTLASGERAAASGSPLPQSTPKQDRWPG